MKSYLRRSLVSIVEFLIAKIAGSNMFEYLLFRILVMNNEKSKTIQGIERLRSLGASLASLGISESQLKQDQWIHWRSEMKKGGYFVDIGACYPVKLSNTYTLEKNWQWRGLLIEPNPNLIPELIAQRTSKVLNLAVGPYSTMELSIARDPEFSSGLLTTQNIHRMFQSSGQKFNVKCMQLKDIFRENHVPQDFDYLSVDVEGAEMEVLKSGDWNIWRPKFITIEHNFSKARLEIDNFLRSVGYERDSTISKFCWDDLYVRKD